MLEVVLSVGGKQRSVIIPPTYEHSVDETVTSTIEDVLAPHGYRISRAILPQKLLAAHSGLACYGKNNITFVDGLGSFHRPLAFYSDLPCEHDTWQEPQMLDECNRCTTCIKKCPTGAIDPERFQLHAERCLTYYNESPEPFPSWLDKSWHHCLIGCMRCQSYCPVNKDVRSWTERYAELTDEETELVLNGGPKEGLPESLLAKLENTGLLDDPAVLARNLKSVLAATD
jgi:epoxyqueuosine reductase